MTDEEFDESLARYEAGWERQAWMYRIMRVAVVVGLVTPPALVLTSGDAARGFEVAVVLGMIAALFVCAFVAIASLRRATREHARLMAWIERPDLPGGHEYRTHLLGRVAEAHQRAHGRC